MSHSLSAVRGFLPALVGLAVLAACGPGSDDGGTPYDLERQHYEAASERVAFVVNCVNDAGFSVSVYQDLSILVEVPEEQMEAFGQAEEVCWDEAETRYPAAPSPSPEELYDLNVAAAACLEAEGFAIPVPPTRESWVDAYPKVLWYPHAYVPDVGEDAWVRINRVCPQPGTR